MSEENIVLNFNDAINALNTVSESFKVEAWVPSKGKYLTFKEIDAKQQKSILNAAIDNSVYSSVFTRAFYEILKSNILNEDPSIIDDLNIADRSFVALALRSQISDEISVNFKDEKTEKVNIKEIISKFGEYKSPDSKELEIKNESATISLIISLPKLKDDLEYEESFYTEKTNDNLKTAKDLQNLVSEAFIGETSKYIKTLKVNDSVFDFSLLTFKQKIKIVEKLPSGLIQKLLEQISIWKKDLDLFLTVKSGEDSKVISIDSLLFLS